MYVDTHWRCSNTLGMSMYSNTLHMTIQLNQQNMCIRAIFIRSTHNNKQGENDLNVFKF